jgi:small subunit ribosomal protein S6
MKRYETIVIIDPDLSKEAEAPIFERVNDLIPQYKGFLIETDDWGTKKLAYDIKKKNRGHYVRLDFCGDGALIQEMERFFRIDDNVMKFMTVLLDENADLDAIKADLAEKAAAEEAGGSRSRLKKNPLKLKNLFNRKTSEPTEAKERGVIWPFQNPAPEERKEEFSTGAKCADSVQTRALSSTIKIPKH